MDASQEQIISLQYEYQNDNAMEQVLDAFSKYMNSMRVVTVDRIWNRVGTNKIKRSQVVSALKKLHSLEFGIYTKGVKGYASRFTFPIAKGPLWLSLLAQGGEEDDLPDDTSNDFIVNEDETGDDNDLVSHKFLLRNNSEIIFNLPSDLTIIEAKRLGLWLKSIPFDSDGEED